MINVDKHSFLCFLVFFFFTFAKRRSRTFLWWYLTGSYSTNPAEKTKISSRFTVSNIPTTRGRFHTNARAKSPPKLRRYRSYITFFFFFSSGNREFTIWHAKTFQKSTCDTQKEGRKDVWKDSVVARDKTSVPRFCPYFFSFLLFFPPLSEGVRWRQRGWFNGDGV